MNLRDEQAAQRQGGLQTATATLSVLGSSRETGLRSEDAAARLAREGANEVPEKKGHPFVRFARKF